MLLCRKGWRRSGGGGTLGNWGRGEVTAFVLSLGTSHLLRANARPASSSSLKWRIEPFIPHMRGSSTTYVHHQGLFLPHYVLMHVQHYKCEQILTVMPRFWSWTLRLRGLHVIERFIPSTCVHDLCAMTSARTHVYQCHQSGILNSRLQTFLLRPLPEYVNFIILIIINYNHYLND